MNLVDSSGWVEYFLGRPGAAWFRSAIHDRANLVVPTICLYEVRRAITKAANRDHAQEAVRQMTQAIVAPLDGELADQAARFSLKYNLAAADAIIYATAQTHEAKLLTLDVDFANLPGVQYFRLQ